MMGNRTNKNPDALLPGERVQAVTLDSIRPFHSHPFKVREDASVKTDNRSRGQPRKSFGHSKAKARKDDEGG